MALGDVYRLILDGTCLGQACQNVLHYKVTAQPGLDPTMAQVVADWEATFLTDWLDLLSAEYTLNGYIIRRLFAGPNDPVYVAAPPASVGTIAGNACASFEAAVISLRTGIPDRSHRGRIFVGGQAESSWSGNTIDAAYAALLTAFATLLSTPWGVAPGGGADFTLTLAVYSRLLNTASAVTGGLIDDNPATMRSRKAGRGI